MRNKTGRIFSRIFVMAIVVGLSTLFGACFGGSSSSNPVPVEPGLEADIHLSTDGVVSFTQAYQRFWTYGPIYTDDRAYFFKVLNQTKQVDLGDYNYGVYWTADYGEILYPEVKTNLNDYAAYEPNQIYCLEIDRHRVVFKEKLEYNGGYKWYWRIGTDYGSEVVWYMYFTVNDQGEFIPLADSFQDQVESITVQYQLPKVLVKGAELPTENNYFNIKLKNGKMVVTPLTNDFVTQIKSDKVGDFTAAFSVGGCKFTHNYTVINATYRNEGEKSYITAVEIGKHDEVVLPQKNPNNNNAVVGLSDNAIVSLKNVKKLTVPFDMKVADLKGFNNLEELALTTTGARMTELFDNQIPDTLKTIKVIHSKKMPAYFFYGCTAIENLQIPNSVTTFEGNWTNGLAAVNHLLIPGSIAIDKAAMPNIQTVRVADGSTELVNYFLSQNDTVQSVFMPDTVTRIINCSLGYNANLREIRLSNALAEIGGMNAMAELPIKNIKFPENLKSVGMFAFMDCNFETVEFGKKISTIESSSFMNCLKLKKAIIPNPKCNWKDGLFEFSPVEELVIGGNRSIKLLYADNKSEYEEYGYPLKKLTVLGDICDKFAEGIRKTSNVELILDDSVTSIGSRAFADCTLFNTFNLNNKVTSLGAEAFYGSSLTTITGTDNFTEVGDNAFYGSPYYNANETIILADGLLVKYTVPENGVVELPSTVKRIMGYAFAGNDVIELVVPESVVSMKSNVFLGQKQPIAKITLYGRTSFVSSSSVTPFDSKYVPTIKVKIANLDWYNNADVWKKYKSNISPL